MRKGVDNKKILAFGKNVARVRKEHQVTQEDLAYKSGLSLSQVARIETGVINTSINTVFIIADALTVHPKRLMDFPFEA